MKKNSGSLWIAHNYSSDVGFAWANISALFRSIARDMHGRGIGLVMSYASDARQAQPPFEQIPAEIVEFDFNERGLKQIIAACRIVRRYRVQYVYLTDQPPTRWLYLWLRLAGVRALVSHNRISVADPYPAKPDGFLKRTLKGLWSRIPGMSADRVYAVSDFVAQRLIVKARVPANRIARIYNGIDTSRFIPASPTDTLPRTVFAGSRAVHHKGIGVLIEACAQLREQNIDLTIRYAGAGPDLDDFRTQAERLGVQDNFLFLGELKGVASEIKKAAIVVVPSNWGEALGSAVLEAMACAKPVIATTAGGIPEVIDDGVTGVLVPPGDAKALADALARLLSDPDYCANLGRAARESAVAHFDIKQYHDTVIAQLTRDFTLDLG